MKALLLSLPLLANVAALAQGDHGHSHQDAPVGASPAAVPIRLTRTIVANLDLQTTEVELRPLEKVFPALGVVEPEPGRVAAVTSRVAGRVTKLAVVEGQRLKAGDLLLEVESRVVADPPPRLRLTAPMDGVVLERNVTPGGAVEPDKVLLMLADLSELDVVAQVQEGRIPSVKPGQRVRIRALAHPDETFVGRVKATAATLSRANGTLRVFVRVDNPAGRLLPGMRAQLSFVTEESETAVLVPREAVLGENGDFFVFRQIMTAPFAYERTPVILGLSDDRFIEVIEGVLPGDRVVTRGNYQLQFAGGTAAKIDDDHGHSHGPGGHQH
jgi:multidrug efflux pump subunit AcrA (membrane-fusion protein)